MKNEITNNTFSGGLLMDSYPLLTPNNVLTNCLNGTLLTFNGNENVLQNDMGNGRVETANLPEGYIPIGTCSHGGFIYIVSYNPLKNLALIGSFPSPERNIDSTELSNKVIKLNNDEFYLNNSELCGMLALKPLIRKTFDDIILNPGDKFIVFSKDLYTKYLSDWNNKNHIIGDIPRHWRIRIASLEEAGKITELDNLKWYVGGEIKDNNLSDDGSNQKDYYIRNTSFDLRNRGDKAIDVDNYRTLVNSSYSIFNSKKSGNLCLLISPEMIDAFSATFSVYKSLNLLKLKNENSTRYDIFINSSWQNGGEDINPEGILVKSENIEYLKTGIKKSFNNSRINFASNSEDFNSEDSNYINSETRFKTEHSNISNDVLSNNSKEYYKNQFTFKKFENSYPSLNYFNQNLYYLGVKDFVRTILSSTEEETSPNYTDDFDYNKPISSEFDKTKTYLTSDIIKPLIIKSDFLNNYLNLDVSVKICSIEVPNEIPENQKNEWIKTIDVYPYMTPGYLSYLKRTLVIDFNKIKKEDIKLTKWKYWILDDHMYINWALEAYTNPEEIISEVKLTFYDNQGACAEQTLSGLSSYNGEFQTDINFGTSSEYYGITKTEIPHKGLPLNGNDANKEVRAIILNKIKEAIKNDNDYSIKDPNDEKYLDYGCNTLKIVTKEDKLENGNKVTYYYTNDSGIIYKGLLYYVGITYKTSKINTFHTEESEEKHINGRWLWTCPIFNEKYNTYDDFKDLKPSILLDLSVSYGITENYEERVGLYSNNNTFSVDEKLDNKNRLSANIQYIHNKSNSDGNLESIVTLGIINNYNTFGINSTKVNSFEVNVFKGNNNCINSIELPNVIFDESNNDVNLLLSKNKIIPYKEDKTEINNIRYTEGLLKFLNIDKISSNKFDLWNYKENLNIFDNQYNFKLINPKSYSNELSYIDNNNETNTLNKCDYDSKTLDIKGLANFKFSFEALYYSKFYTTGNTSKLYNLKTLRAAIQDESDFANYNLLFITIGANKIIAFKEGLLCWTWDKDGPSAKMGLALTSINIKDGLFYVPAGIRSDRKQKGDYDEGASSFFSHYLLDSEFESVRKYFKDKKIFMFPIITNMSVDNSKFNDPPIITHNNTNYCYAQNFTGGWTQNKQNTGGFVGITTNENIYCDFYRPISNYNKYEENCKEVNLYGCNYTFYPTLLLGMLTNLYFPTNTYSLYNIYSYDNYTYYEPFSTKFNLDLIYEIKVKDNINNNNLLIMSGLNYIEYLNGIKNKIETFNENNLTNTDIQIIEIKQNVPVQFEFKYKLPETIKNDFNDVAILLSEDGNKLIHYYDDLLYTLDETNNLVPANNSSIFKVPTKFKNIKLETDYNKPKINNVKVGEYLTTQNISEFRFALLDYLKIENNRLIFDNMYLLLESDILFNTIVESDKKIPIRQVPKLYNLFEYYFNKAKNINNFIEQVNPTYIDVTLDKQNITLTLKSNG